MSTVTDPAADLRRKLTNHLTATGALHSPQWQAAFAAVPREEFLTGGFTTYAPGQNTQTRHVPGDPHYLETVYSDDSLITLRDAVGTATSSSSQPSVMATMLEALSPLPPSARVLEIGTGTGYNTALLAHHLGDHNVTSIDIDPDLTARAREALHRASYSPHLITGDGLAGHPDSTPYNGLIATCGVYRVPTTWLTQVCPGGTIVVNIGHALAALTVDEEGGAAGPLLPMKAAFMVARPAATSPAPASSRDLGELMNAPGDRVVAALPDLTDDMPQLLRAVIQPDVDATRYRHPQGHTTHLLREVSGSSWARITTQPEGMTEAVQDGPRRLFEEWAPLVAAWHTAGRPGQNKYRLTVHPDGTHELTLGTTRWQLP